MYQSIDSSGTNVYVYVCMYGGGGGGGVLHSTPKIFGLRCCENEGSKRFKINEKEGQLD